MTYAWNRPNHHIPDIQIHIHFPDIHFLKLVVRLVQLLLLLMISDPIYVLYIVFKCPILYILYCA